MICANCAAEKPECSLCSACGTTPYCGRDCQVAHWPVHKKECAKTPNLTQPKKEADDPEPVPAKPKASLLDQLGYTDEIEAEKKRKHEEYLKNPIHKYEILEEIGSGNFTSIHRALEKESGKHWAMKIAEKKILVKKHKERDLLAEKHCLNKLKGVAGVVQIHQTFQDELNLYIVMELVQGKELWEIMNMFGFKKKARAYHYFVQLLNAVAGLHKIGIVHRDLKPENVMVRNSDDRLVVIDFGSAKDVVENVASKGNSSTGRKYFEHFMGTPNYMAPECIHNKFSDARSDVYSLGCFFYNLVVGQPPFLGGSEYLIFRAALDSAPLFYDFLFDQEEAKMVLQMINKEAEKRPVIDELVAFFTRKAGQLKEDEEVVGHMDGLVTEAKAMKEMNEEKAEEWFREKLAEAEEKFGESRAPLITKHMVLLKRQAIQYWRLGQFEHKPI